MTLCFPCLGPGELFLNSCEVLMACAVDLLEDRPLGFPDVSMLRVVVEMMYNTREQREHSRCQANVSRTKEKGIVLCLRSGRRFRGSLRNVEGDRRPFINKNFRVSCLRARAF